MSLINAVKNIARRVYANDKKVGDLAQLATRDKSSIIAAINALATDLGGRENISVQRVAEIAQAELAKLTDGASAAFDTLAEIESAFKSNESQVASLLVEIGVAKNKAETLETELNAVKTYVGYEQRETLQAEITRILNTGK